MKEFFSQGKVLLTAEYAVLEGVKALALPTIKGQSLTVKTTESQSIVWKAFTHDNQLWIDAVLDFQFRCIYAGDTSPKVIKKLVLILQAMEKLSPSFYKRGVEITTHLDFPQDWGLGSSSTLINNLAQWLTINPYILLDNTFGGSGYDLAAAQSKGALFYTRNAFSPTIEKVSFDPPFKDNLYFVYLNQKRNSQEAIKGYAERKSLSQSNKKRLEKIGEELLSCKAQENFNRLLKEHEDITGDFLGEPPVQARLFPDFNGQIKSLGAWGGDFVLVSGDRESPQYFMAKGYSTVISFHEFIL